jgi:hypothetical protein
MIAVVVGSNVQVCEEQLSCRRTPVNGKWLCRPCSTKVLGVRNTLATVLDMNSRYQDRTLREAAHPLPILSHPEVCGRKISFTGLVSIVVSSTR